MIYRVLADILLISHMMFIVFVIFGGLLVLWKKWIMPIHLICAIWGAMIEFFRWGCPLTPWENEMRMLGGQAGFSGGFIEHYLMPIIYPGQMTAVVQFLLGSVVVIVNVVIYYFVVKRLRKRKLQVRKEM
jgi:hypothetical protein